ncbi:hypothetical protein DL96DRAFT_1630909 [Flagelloscypha sp. PMI_526]|nr:hypothetical protein DL96DRAFT_1630909 [Flagelloscypha sp. PMI_526]
MAVTLTFTTDIMLILERVARQHAIQEPRVLRPEPPRQMRHLRPEEPAPTSPPPLYRSIGFAAPEAEVHQFLPSTEEQFSNVVPLDEPEGAERLQRDFPDFPTFDELEMYLYAQACIQSSSDLQQDLEPPSLCLKSAFDEPSPDLSDEDPLNGLFASELSAFDGVWVDDLPFAPNTCPHDQPVPPEGADQVLNRRGEKQKKIRRVPRAHSENKVKRVYEGRRKWKAVGGRKMRL